ncbi:MAG: hypothetical protein AMJ46_07435 [Latescibacteria bacterium DG_63]|uniref:N-acetyltransferase domain-containing protein n=2 Tax=Bacteria division TA06 TaxID=1156500 RepID=A0A0S8JMD6_UNCT6|nr:MAG: hypothetical protein AMJ46_07435 [Latescibacteria bacterium DG_63]KPK69117.1 MAG: hypothetical protein AMJ82_06320 [candidate division TA06 bacterium SM23_40]KPL10897.1 MAG: hypothetical protein AMJ71_01530 [candidate division TA06 bacterium SM1_40]
MPSSEGSKEATVSGQGTVRLPRREDASRVAELYHQLGYRVSRREVLRRLEEIEQNEHHVGFVAESSHGEIVGFVHAYLRLLIESGLRAEVGGLIVDEEYRRTGIGRLLMETAEQWARDRGCWAVHLRSNVVREGARVFYEKIGYTVIKKQQVFQKVL